MVIYVNKHRTIDHSQISRRALLVHFQLVRFAGPILKDFVRGAQRLAVKGFHHMNRLVSAFLHWLGHLSVQHKDGQVRVLRLVSGPFADRKE